MDCLLAYYTEKFTKLDGNVFEVFSKFYSLDLYIFLKYILHREDALMLFLDLQLNHGWNPSSKVK